VEVDYRNKYNAVSAQLQTCEAERVRAWRKMLKTKAELGIPHEQVHPVTGRRTMVKLDYSNYVQLQCPSIRSTAQQSVSRELDRQRASVASYTPPASSDASTSKYSAAKIKERKAADGTIAPVTEPKKTKDGLYMRPAGRTRKGMRWDPVAGVWCPLE
jgi:hypothetical protein